MKSILVDIGNSAIVFALADGKGSILETWRTKTVKDATLSFYRNETAAAMRCFSLSKENFGEIKYVIISSVVPEINDKVAQAIFDTTGFSSHFFSLEDACKFIGLDIESPSQLGRDRLADAIGARHCYGAPCIIIDMGTATTVGVINNAGNFAGGMIIPGVKTSLKALSAKASQLPTINIEKPLHLVGGNTVECMQSGIVYGTACMIDGIIDRIMPTLSGDVRIVATGGLAKQIAPFCKYEMTVDPFLLFKGLAKLVEE